MFDSIRLQHFSLGEFNWFGLKRDCENVFAFREFSPDVSQKHMNSYGLNCSLHRFTTLMNGSTNYHANIFKLVNGISEKINYVFATRGDLCCVRDQFVYLEVRDNKEIYFNGDYEDCIRTSCNYALDDEHDTLRKTMGVHSTLMCSSNGVLPGMQAVEWHDALSNITNLCNAATTNFTPWLFVPTLLSVSYVIDIAFSCLSDWLTSLNRTTIE